LYIRTGCHSYRR